MTKRLALAAPLLALAGCGDGGDGPPPAEQIAIANPYNDALLRASEFSRNATIRAAVARNRQPCERVLEAAHTGRHKNLQLWTVRCVSPRGGGYRYGLFLAPDGQTQVRSCQAMRTLGLPACREDV